MQLLNRSYCGIFFNKQSKKCHSNHCIHTTLSLSNERVKSFSEVPGPLSLPIIGTLYQYLPIIGRYKFNRLEVNGLKKLQKFGPLVREEIAPGVNILWIFDPDDMKTMFNADDVLYPKRRSHLALEKYRLDRPNVYHTAGLLPTNGPEWRRIRLAFQKGLSAPRDVLAFLPETDKIIQEWIDVRINKIHKEPDIDYLPELSRLFLEVIGSVALDIRLDSFSKRELLRNSRSSKLLKSALVTNNVVLRTDNASKLWKKFETPLYKQLRKSQEYMESVAIDLLSLKMCLFREQGGNSTLLEKYFANSTVDFQDIIGVVCDFFLAGMDTTSYTTSFVLYYLAKNPQVQQTLYEEACRLLPSPNADFPPEKYDSAQYARAVLKETLRLRPISVGIGRISTKDCVLSGYAIPPGTVMVTQNQVICRLEKYFDDPLAFKPERWINPSAKIHPYVMLPFGHGVRSCIAKMFAQQNMVLVMLRLVRKYHIEWNGEELDTRSMLINQPDGPLLIDLRER